MNKSKKRIAEIDTLRGLAALWVVFYHYTYRYGQIYGENLLPWTVFKHGYLGVQVFFVISGFVIYLTLERRNNLLDFAVSRFSRLFPVYWAAIGVTFFAGRGVRPSGTGGLPGARIGKPYHASGVSSGSFCGWRLLDARVGIVVLFLGFGSLLFRTGSV